jgi:hypothetical protein
MIYCLKAIRTLSNLLSLPDSTTQLLIPGSSASVSSGTLITKLSESHKTLYFDETKGTFVSGKDRQVSWAAASWAVIAGVVKGEEAKMVMRNAYVEGSVKGMTPYLHHYVSF